MCIRDRTIMVPMLLDWAVTPANVRFSRPCSAASRNDWSARGSRSGTNTGVAGVIAQSSNIGTMMVGEKVPPATLEKYFRGFGVGQPSGIQFPGETPGIFAKSQNWSGSQRYTVMYGQG